MQSQAFIEFIVNLIGERGMIDALKDSQSGNFLTTIESYTHKSLTTLINEFQEAKLAELRQKMAV
jgi:hypothetical protein